MRGFLARGCLMAVLSVLIVGCETPGLPGPIAQLDRYQKAEAAGQYKDIVADSLSGDCTGGGSASDACPKLHAIRARACLTLAHQAAAPNAACPGSGARDLLACAAENYGAVLDSATFSPAQRTDFRDNHARATYCLANLSAGAERQSLGQQALDDLTRLPQDPRRDQLAASTALLLADGASGTARCDLYRQAAARARRGLGEQPTADVAAGLQSALNTAQARAGRANCGRI